MVSHDGAGGRARADRGPVWASHNNCRALVDHNRQFSDEMIRALMRHEVRLEGRGRGASRHDFPAEPVAVEQVNGLLQF